VDLTSATSPIDSRKRKTSSSSPVKKGKKKLADIKYCDTSSRSLYNFFQPATEEQQWSALKSEIKPLSEQVLDDVEDKEDLIEDDYSSCEDIFQEQLSREETVGSVRYNSSQVTRKQASHPSSRSDQPRKSYRPPKRFLLPSSPSIQRRCERVDVDTKPGQADGRPWPERYAPSNLDELAVHKKKVAEVRNWLTDVFAGKGRRVRLSFHDLIWWRHIRF
jgi:cell cycle checkpoint protein